MSKGERASKGLSATWRSQHTNADGTTPRPDADLWLPRAIADLHEPKLGSEEVHRLSQARVVVVDDELLSQHFLQTSDAALLEANPGLGALPESGLPQRLAALREQWILRHCAVMSKGQVAQCRVNTPIPVQDECITAYRPPRYGRALIVPVSAGDGDRGGGLLDVKGVGVAPGIEPHFGDHGSGLEPLGEALEEYAYQRLIEGIFRHAGSDFHALPPYAVLDLGFDIKLEETAEATFPAGAYVRPAHRRWPGGRELPRYGTPEQQVLWEIELLLRHYGVTSATADTYVTAESEGRLKLSYRGTELPVRNQRMLRALLRATFDQSRPRSPRRSRRAASGNVINLSGINIQTTADISSDPSHAVVVDFGHFEVHTAFTDVLLSLVADRPFMWGDVLSPDMDGYVLPDLKLAVPESEWGWVTLPPAEVEKLGYPSWYNPFSRLELFCIDLALAYRRGLPGSDVKARLDALVARALRR